jgi:hypothetical protein
MRGCTGALSEGSASGRSPARVRTRTSGIEAADGQARAVDVRIGEQGAVRVPDGTAAAALVRPAVVGDDDVAGVVQGTCRADRGAFVGTMPPVEHGADHVRLATVEGGGAGVFGIARVPADAESKTPAAEGEGGPAGAGTETSGPLGGIDVLLVVADGLSAVAAQDQGGDVQPRGGRVAGGGSDHRGGPGRRRRRRWPGCPVRCRGLDRPPRSAGHPARPEDHP